MNTKTHQIKYNFNNTVIRSNNVYKITIKLKSRYNKNEVYNFT